MSSQRRFTHRPQKDVHTQVEVSGSINGVSQSHFLLFQSRWNIHLHPETQTHTHTEREYSVYGFFFHVYLLHKRFALKEQKRKRLKKDGG